MIMKSKRDVIYCGGPGDIAGTMRNWISGKHDASEVSDTYSGQFFDQIKARGLSALVISSHAHKKLLHEGSFTVEHRPNPANGKSGLAYKRAYMSHWLDIIGTILRQHPRVVVIADLEHWWLLTIPALFGIKVITDLQCTFWPRGYRSSSLYQKILQSFNGMFWRHIPIATICISPECERQVKEMTSGRVSGSLLQARSSYQREHFEGIKRPTWDADSFRLMFAGRVERTKGVFDLLDVMASLTGDGVKSVSLEICGGGTALSELKAEVSRRGLQNCIKVLGQLNSSEMRAAYERCHMVIVPTTADFPEGLNRVVVEGVLSGRPVVATEVCPVIDILPDSVITVTCGDIPAITKAITKAASDKKHYESTCKSCGAESEQFYDRKKSWGEALSRALDMAIQ